MKILAYSVRPYEEALLKEQAEEHSHSIDFLETRLHQQTAALCAGYDGICAFVNDELNSEVLEIIAEKKVKYIALRSAGFNHVDLCAARRLGIKVVRVPAYSPHAVAEHTVGLLLCLNRKIHKAYQRVREGNFSLNGLMGFDLCGKTIGVVGCGKIGAVLCKILRGFSCDVLAYDAHPSKELMELGVHFTDKESLLKKSHVVSLHLPLNSETRHFIDQGALEIMREDSIIINTSRGELLDTKAVLQALKKNKLAGLGIDVYEEEEHLFFEDHSIEGIQDDTFARLTTFPNVLITGHQAFLTKEALHNICETTMKNFADLEKTGESPNLV